MEAAKSASVEVAALGTRVHELQAQISGYREKEVATELRNRLERIGAATVSSKNMASGRVVAARECGYESDPGAVSSGCPVADDSSIKVSPRPSIRGSLTTVPETRMRSSDRDRTTTSHSFSHQSPASASNSRLPSPRIDVYSQAVDASNSRLPSPRIDVDSQAVGADASTSEPTVAAVLNADRPLHSPHSLPFYIHNKSAGSAKTSRNPSPSTRDKLTSDTATVPSVHIIGDVVEVHASNASNNHSVDNSMISRLSSQGRTGEILQSADSGTRQHYNRLKVMYDRIAKIEEKSSVNPNRVQDHPR